VKHTLHHVRGSVYCAGMVTESWSLYFQQSSVFLFLFLLTAITTSPCFPFQTFETILFTIHLHVLYQHFTLYLHVICHLFTIYLHVFYQHFTLYLHVICHLFTIYLHVFYLHFTCQLHVICHLFTIYLHEFYMLFTCCIHSFYIIFTCHIHVNKVTRIN
jgi:hypothetical protein